MTSRGLPSPITRPLFKHDQAAADPHHLFQIVLDQHDGDATGMNLGDGLDLLRGLGMIEARPAAHRAG